MNPSTRAFIAVSIAALVLHAPIAAFAQEEFPAEVAPQMARFTFPVETRTSFPFNALARGYREYAWEIEVQNGDTTYTFGLSHFSYPPVPGAQPQTLTLKELLPRCQAGVWVGNKFDTSIDVAAEIVNGAVVLTVAGNSAVRRLFGDFPHSVKFISEEAKGTITTRMQVQYLDVSASFAQPVVTKRAPAPKTRLEPLVLRDPRKARKNIAQLTGSVAVLTFWDTGCPSCLEEYPSIAAAAAKWRDKGVVFIGLVLGDSKRNVDRFLATQKDKGPDQYRVSFAVLRQYGGIGTPYLVILDKKGRIAYRRYPDKTGVEALLSARLPALLAE